jgi:hypothetical protein
MRVGDLAFFYHSSCKVPGIVGIVKVRRHNLNPKPTTCYLRLVTLHRRGQIKGLEVGVGGFYYCSVALHHTLYVMLLSFNGLRGSSGPTGWMSILNLCCFYVAQVVREAYPDVTAFDPASQYYDASSSRDNPKWWQVCCSASRVDFAVAWSLRRT